jgi:hypothetical protein
MSTKSLACWAGGEGQARGERGREGESLLAWGRLVCSVTVTPRLSRPSFPCPEVSSGWWQGVPRQISFLIPARLMNMVQCDAMRCNAFVSERRGEERERSREESP